MSNRFLVILSCIAAAVSGILAWAVVEVYASLHAEYASVDSRLARLERSAGIQPPEKDEIAFPDVEDHQAATMRRIANLTERVRKLEDAIAALGSRRAAGSVPANASEADVRALLESIDDSEVDAETVFSPGQLKAVRKLLEQVREEDRKRRINNFANNIKLRMRDEYMRWKDELRFTPEQEKEVDKFLDETLRKAVVAWDRYLEDGDVESLRKELGDVRRSVDSRAYEVLDASQVERLKELDPRGFGARNKDR